MKEQEQLWIGITNCDKWRESRTKDIEELVKELVNIADYDKAALISLPSLDLLREAYSCYQNGAYMGVAIMCRAVTEAVVYFSLARRENQPKHFSCGTVKIDFSYIDLKWGDIVCKAKELGIIDNDLGSKIKDVRRYGNFTVHYGEILDKAHLKIRQEGGANTPNGWLSREKALEVLRKTIGIFNEVLKRQAQGCDFMIVHHP